MEAICVKDNIGDVSKELLKFAYTQDEKGIADVTIGKKYRVYGIRLNSLGKFYLVLTDSINTKLPWWMPADLYTVVDDMHPKSWEESKWKGFGEETVTANPLYIDAMEDIEDSTERGLEVFEAMKNDGN